MKQASEERKNRSFFKRLSFAVNGVKAAVKTEASFRVQLIASVLVCGVLFICEPSTNWTALLLLSCGLVLSLELINTAFEKALDQIHPQYQESIGTAKDVLAGAVLVASGCALLVMISFLFSSDARPLFDLLEGGFFK